MLGSENHFFKQPIEVLQEKREQVSELLRIKGYGSLCVSVYLKAYDYFIDNPTEFDGATLVKDLCDLPDLDIDSMIHDWLYIALNAGSSVKYKWMADMIFSKGMEQKGKGIYSAYSRFAGLTLSGIGFIAFARLKRGRITKEQKEEIKSIYDLIVKKV